MDRSTELLVEKAPEAVRWEDEEKASYDVESLRKAFNRHMYGRDEAPTIIKRRMAAARTADR